MADTSTETPEPVNFQYGWPNSDLLPVSQIRHAANLALSTPSIANDALHYGPDPGYEPCRAAIAAWLAPFYRPSNDPTRSSTISPDRICITGGASQSLGALLGVYTDPVYTRRIWIVEPAYMLAFRIFEDAGFFGERLRGVPEDSEGIDLDFLRREIQLVEDQTRHEPDEPHFKPPRARAKCYKHLIYCVPTFSNPSAQTMSLVRREELVRIAREFDALVVTDDVYDFLQWPASSQSEGDLPPMPTTALLPRLVDIDRDLEGGPSRPGADGFGNAMSNGSFSKIAGPGLRVGWVEGTPAWAYGISQAGITRSGGAPSQLTSTYITTLLQPTPPSLSPTTGILATFIHTVLQPAYARRYALLTTAIHTHLSPLGFSTTNPTGAVVGGYFVWLRLPAGMMTREYVPACAAKGVVVASGEDFGVSRASQSGGAGVVGLGEPTATDHSRFSAYVRLSFAWVAEAQLTDGVRRMAAAAEQVLNRDVNSRRAG